MKLKEIITEDVKEKNEFEDITIKIKEKMNELLEELYKTAKELHLEKYKNDFCPSEPGFDYCVGFDLDRENPGQGVVDFISYLDDNNCNIKEYLKEMNVESDTVYFIFPKDYVF